MIVSPSKTNQMTIRFLHQLCFDKLTRSPSHGSGAVDLLGLKPVTEAQFVRAAARMERANWK